MRKRLRQRDGENCWFCHLPMDFQRGGTAKNNREATIDHIVERSNGGCSSPKNVRLAHLYCNNARSNGQWTPEKERKWIVKVLLPVARRDLWLRSMIPSEWHHLPKKKRCSTRCESLNEAATQRVERRTPELV